MIIVLFNRIFHLITLTGNRNCIGQNFAITELKMAVAKLIYNFEVVAHQPEKVTRIIAMIQKPLNLYLKFIPRDIKSWSEQLFPMHMTSYSA